MWKDVTNSVDIIWHKDIAMFSGNVSGRFWLIFRKKNSKTEAISDIIPVANLIYSQVTRTRYRAGVSAKITVRFFPKTILNQFKTSNEVEVKFISKSPSSVDLYLGETFSCQLLNDKNHVIKNIYSAIPFKPFQELSFSLKQFASSYQLPDAKIKLDSTENYFPKSSSAFTLSIKDQFIQL